MARLALPVSSFDAPPSDARHPEAPAVPPGQAGESAPLDVDCPNAWQRIQLARHPQRPRMLDYVERLFDNFMELHGDHVSGDDPALVCGIADFEGRPVFIVGHQKGVSTEEKVLRNFGMAHPEGYRKALRIFQLAERFRKPVLCFVDTPAAHPGITAEEHGQGVAIAHNLLALMRLDTPVFAAILGEGGSGGALGIAVADWIAMFEYAVYMICPPERCAEILWRDAKEKEKAAEALKVTAEDLLRARVIDKILPEPRGGAHTNPQEAACILREEIRFFLDQARAGAWTLEQRRNRFREIGYWIEPGNTDSG